MLIFAFIFHAHVVRSTSAQPFASGVKSLSGVKSSYSQAIILSLAVNEQIRKGSDQDMVSDFDRSREHESGKRGADPSASRRLLSSSGLDMKIEFAPADVPLVRRLQTAAVLQWVFSFLALGKCKCFYCIFRCSAKPLSVDLEWHVIRVWIVWIKWNVLRF